MATQIWRELNCAALIGPLACELLRLVESQQKVATMQLVDSGAEQALLEQLLEENKPAVAADARPLHYLLMTPFRYPPLPYGSRFGRAHERGIFYGSLELETALAECAYYRLVFLAGVAEPFPAPLTTYHTAFRARVDTPRGLALNQPAFEPWREQLCSPTAYATPQALGSLMREAGVEAFLFHSARRRPGTNAGVFAPRALAAGPLDETGWVCRASASEVRFICPSAGSIHSFPRGDFLVDGTLPQPAVATMPAG